MLAFPAITDDRKPLAQTAISDARKRNERTKPAAHATGDSPLEINRSPAAAFAMRAWRASIS